MRASLRICWGWMLLLGVVLASNAWGADGTGQLAAEQRAALSRTIRSVLIDSLPRQIEDADDWGAQREMLSGMKLESVEGKPRLSKRTKQVNHGLWRQIVVEGAAGSTGHDGDAVRHGPRR